MFFDTERGEMRLGGDRRFPILRSGSCGGRALVLLIVMRLQAATSGGEVIRSSGRGASGERGQPQEPDPEVVAHFEACRFPPYPRGRADLWGPHLRVSLRGPPDDPQHYEG